MGSKHHQQQAPCLRPKIFEIRIVKVAEVTSLFGVKKFNNQALQSNFNVFGLRIGMKRMTFLLQSKRRRS